MFISNNITGFLKPSKVIVWLLQSSFCYFSWWNYIKYVANMETIVVYIETVMKIVMN